MAKKKTVFTTSVKSYKEGINSEKQQMDTYSKRMGSSVRSLQGDFRKHSKEMHEAGRNMIAEGNRNMNAKVGKFKAKIRDQLKENNNAIARMGDGVKFFLSEVNKKKKDFHAYQRGPFQAYIKAFWG